MTVSDIHIFKYKLPLCSPLTFNGKKVSDREGLIIQVETSAGASGYGEISPLPGFSEESLGFATKQIQQIKSILIGQDLPVRFDKVHGALAAIFEEIKLCASVRFGLEMAILHILSQSQKKSLRALMGSAVHDAVQVCGLLQGSKEEVLKDAQQMLDQGFKEFKLKVGRTSIDQDIELVQALTKILENKALLRLDANRKWSMADAVKLGNEVGLTALEYVEEPFKDLSKIEEFFSKTTIPVALDENLQDVALHDVKTISGVEVLILKPSIRGGISETLAHIKEAQSYGMIPIISSSFETGLGIRVLAEMASCTRVAHPAGLDTLKWFEEDLVDDYITITRAHIDLKKKIQFPQNLKKQFLSPISND